MSGKVDVAVYVNGVMYARHVEPRMLLSDFLRHELGLTGTHVGCEHGVCGACTILLEGRSARSCLLLAVQVDGAEIETIEGQGSIDQLGRVQQAMRQHHGLQCGFCTPGFVMTITDILRNHDVRGETEIREALSGNICRCTGYEHIVNAVQELLSEQERAR
ncbi:(2Fe-2S)-binding protein [Acidiphilium sp.]|jgi:carbon-monoxide dehydrogenase small subunit|uniref:(2Fe-2S)-binding protein n=1 Tax=Acidiphilium sp. TaxID=527 RepID=UPI002582B5E6|nr:(2Fe-2S)-binding protein [Acidiphilium sp.]